MPCVENIFFSYLIIESVVVEFILITSVKLEKYSAIIKYSLFSYVNISNSRRSQGRDAAVLGFKGSLAYSLEKVWHVEQFSAIRLISLDIPGQKN